MRERSISTDVPTIEDAIHFHGHLCPGLAMGYRAAVATLKALEVARPRDEELVAIAEGDACDVDAVQLVTGCTAGKGNLIVHPIGKHAFTFVRRDTGEAIRVVLRYPENLEDPDFNALRSRVISGAATPKETEKFRKRMESVSRAILDMPEKDILMLTRTTVQMPHKARIYRSVTCTRCGEQCAEPLARLHEGKIFCLSCLGDVK
jgi:formylmethanofuran dehydrogenase subunit E